MAHTLALLDLLPSVKCVSPKDVAKKMKMGAEGMREKLASSVCVSGFLSISVVPSEVLMDVQEYKSPTYQRVYQYLKRHFKETNLDHFSYTGEIEGTPVDCLEVILRYVT